VDVHYRPERMRTGNTAADRNDHLYKSVKKPAEPYKTSAVERK
jgi:hypothetical protein